MKRYLSLLLIAAILATVLATPVSAHPAGSNVPSYQYNNPGTDGSNNSLHLHYTAADGKILMPQFTMASKEITGTEYYFTDPTDRRSALPGATTRDSEAGLYILTGEDYWLSLQDNAGNTIDGVTWTAMATRWNTNVEGDAHNAANELITITSNGKLSAHDCLEQQKYELWEQGVFVDYTKMIPLLDGNGDPVLDGAGNPILSPTETDVTAFVGYWTLVIVAHKDGMEIFRHNIIPSGECTNVGRGTADHVYLYEPDYFMPIVDAANNPVMVPKTNGYGEPEIDINSNPVMTQLEMPVYLIGSRKTRNIQAWIDPPFVNKKDILWSINDKAYDFLSLNPHKETVAVLTNDGVSDSMEEGLIDGVSTTIYDHLIEKMGFAHMVPSNVVKTTNLQTTVSTVTVLANHLDPGIPFKYTYLVASSKVTRSTPPYNAAHADAILKVVRSVDTIKVYKAEDDHTDINVKPTEFHVLPITKTQEFKAVALPDDAYADWRDIEWIVSDEDGNEYTDKNGNPIRDAKGNYQMITPEGEVVTVGSKPAQLDILLTSLTGLNATVQAIGPGIGYLKAKSTEPHDSAYALVEILVPIESGEIFLQGGITDLYVPVGEVRDLIVEFYPPNTTQRELQWWVRDVDNPAARPQANKIAAVSSGGNVTGFTPGETIVYVSTVDGMHVTYCRVHVIVPAAEIKISPTEYSLEVGQGLVLTTTILPQISNAKVIWSSDNPAVASVDDSGHILAISPGVANIAATTEAELTADGTEKTATCVITVTQDVQAITLNKKSLLMNNGSTVILTTKIVPNTATNAEIEWTSSDKSVVTVNSAGELVAVGTGAATITAKVKANPGITDTCVVQVIEEITAISLDPAEFTVNKGQSKGLTATVMPVNVASMYLTWRSSNPAVAIVSNTGVVTAVGNGFTTITVSNADETVTATSTVNVAENITSVSLNKTQLQLEKGESEKLAATVTPSTADLSTLTWSTSNSKVATVDSTGSITTLMAGSATIYLNLSNGTAGAWCYVTVIEPLNAIKINPDKAEMTVGSYLSLYVTAEPVNAGNTGVSWYSSNPNIVSVSSDGQVHANAKGDAVITAMSTYNNAITATTAITVKDIEVTEVTLNQASSMMGRGDILQLKATIAPSNASDGTVTWTSSNTQAAIVDSYGKVTAINGGTATITATAGQKTATCVLTINAVSVISLLMDKQTYTLELGKTEQLTATVIPATASNPTLTWSSSNAAVVVVDQNGNITGGMAGTAIVYAVTEDGNKTAQCTVTVIRAVALEQLAIKTSTKIAAGKSETLTPTFTPTTATNRDITWTSSNTSVATVDASGKVVAVSEGTAVITVTSADERQTASCEVLVEVPGNAAKAAMSKMLTGAADKSTAAALEFIARYAENEIEKEGSVVASGEVVTLNNSTELQDLATESKEAEAAVTEVLRTSGLTLTRDLQTGITIDATQASKTTIIVTAAAANLSTDNVSIKVGDYRILLSKKMIKDNTANGEVRITVEPLISASQQQVRIDIDKTLTEPIRLLSVPLAGSADYQTVVDSSGKTVMTYYNISGNKNEALITASGTYKTVNNTKIFSDMEDQSIEMQEAVKVLAAKGVINGRTATEFDPNGKITRAEIASLIVRMLSKTDTRANATFKDVKSTDWFHDTVHAANNANYMEGVGNNNFSPNTTISKGQIITIISRVLTNEKGFVGASASYLDKFTDKASIPSWATAGVALAVKSNLVPGSADTFEANAEMTRGETAIVLYRLYKLLG